jgi:hypothetical protein
MIRPAEKIYNYLIIKIGFKFDITLMSDFIKLLEYSDLDEDYHLKTCSVYLIGHSDINPA